MKYLNKYPLSQNDSNSLFIDAWFFFCLDFLLHDIHDSQYSRGKGRLFLIPLYHFHPLHKNLHIRRAITTDSSFLHMANARSHREHSVSGSKSLSTKPRTLNRRALTDAWFIRWLYIL